MSIDNLKSSLPEYAKDQKLNLGTLTRSKDLDEEQLWGCLLASAAACLVGSEMCIRDRGKPASQ